MNSEVCKNLRELAENQNCPEKYQCFSFCFSNMSSIDHYAKIDCLICIGKNRDKCKHSFKIDAINKCRCPLYLFLVHNFQEILKCTGNRFH